MYSWTFGWIWAIYNEVINSVLPKATVIWQGYYNRPFKTGENKPRVTWLWKSCLVTDGPPLVLLSLLVTPLTGMLQGPGRLTGCRGAVWLWAPVQAGQGCCVVKSLQSRLCLLWKPISHFGKRQLLFRVVQNSESNCRWLLQKPLWSSFNNETVCRYLRYSI